MVLAQCWLQHRAPQAWAGNDWEHSRLHGRAACAVTLDPMLRRVPHLVHALVLPSWNSESSLNKEPCIFILRWASPVLKWACLHEARPFARKVFICEQEVEQAGEETERETEWGEPRVGCRATQSPLEFRHFGVNTSLLQINHCSETLTTRNKSFCVVTLFHRNVDSLFSSQTCA